MSREGARLLPSPTAPSKARTRPTDIGPPEVLSLATDVSKCGAPCSLPAGEGAKAHVYRQHNQRVSQRRRKGAHREDPRSPGGGPELRHSDVEERQPAAHFRGARIAAVRAAHGRGIGKQAV